MKDFQVQTKIVPVLVCVCLVFSSCSEQSTPYLSRSDISDISHITGIDGIAVGCAASSGRCYLLAKQLVAEYSLEELKVLVESDDPYVRCVGMICLANDIETYRNIILCHGTTEQRVKYVPVGCLIEEATVKEFAEKLVNDEQFRLCYIGEFSDLEKMFKDAGSD